MPLTIGQALDRAEISSDDTTGNLEELKSTLLEFEYSPGDQTEDYTAVGDDTVNNEGIKPNPYIRARFKPESDDDESIAIVIAGGGKRAFDFQVVADSTNNRGIRIHGTGRLVRGDGSIPAPAAPITNAASCPPETISPYPAPPPRGRL